MSATFMGMRCSASVHFFSTKPMIVVKRSFSRSASFECSSSRTALPTSPILTHAHTCINIVWFSINGYTHLDGPSSPFGVRLW